MIVRVPAADVPTLEREARLQTVRTQTIYIFNLDFDRRERTPQATALAVLESSRSGKRVAIRFQ